MNKASEWLQKKMQAENMSLRELARAVQKSHTTISDALNGKASEKTWTALAKYYKEPPEVILRKAGFLPPKTEKDELIDTILHELDQLPPREREDIIEYIRLRRELVEKKQRSELKPQKANPFQN